jgi:hypothetical protein
MLKNGDALVLNKNIVVGSVFTFSSTDQSFLPFNTKNVDTDRFLEGMLSISTNGRYLVSNDFSNYHVLELSGHNSVLSYEIPINPFLAIGPQFKPQILLGSKNDFVVQVENRLHLELNDKFILTAKLSRGKFSKKSRLSFPKSVDSTFSLVENYAIGFDNIAGVVYVRDINTDLMFTRHSTIINKHGLKSIKVLPDGNMTIYSHEFAALLDKDFNEKRVVDFEQFLEQSYPNVVLSSDVLEDSYAVVTQNLKFSGYNIDTGKIAPNSQNTHFIITSKNPYRLPDVLLGSNGKILVLNSETLSLYDSNGKLITSFELTQDESENGRLIRVGVDKFIIHVPRSTMRTFEI